MTDWDAVVGVKGDVNLGAERKWFVPCCVDVGRGQSDLTWQANVGIGFRFDWGAVVASWRYLDYKFKSGQSQAPDYAPNWQVRGQVQFMSP